MKAIFIQIAIVMALIAIYASLTIHYFEEKQKEYHRGYIDGIASVKKPDLDKQCFAWWLDTNIAAAKNKFCKGK